MKNKKSTFLVSAVLLAAGASNAQSTPAAECRIGEAQQLMGQASPPHERITSLLADCARATPDDWRVHWLQGVHARDRQQLDAARTALQRAHALAPDEAAPALDLAVVHEWDGQPASARALYAQVLRADPGSRPALLGSARVARAEGRRHDARAIYEAMLARDARDVDAINGLAWVNLAGMQLDEAQRGFDAALAAQPGNAEAQQGLQQLQQSWRYQLDLGVGTYNLSAGNATSANAGLRVNLSDTDQLEFGLARNSRELPSVQLIDPTPLPSWVARVGYKSQPTYGLTWSVAYEYRERRFNPEEHRVELGLGSRIVDGVRWYGGVRQGFGADAWHNRLTHLGLGVDIARYWSVTGTLYSGDSRLGGTSKAVSLDLYRDTGALGMLFNVGVGYSPDPDNTSIHARLVYPIATRQAIVFAVEHRSLGGETEASIGWRYFWR